MFGLIIITAFAGVCFGIVQLINKKYERGLFILIPCIVFIAFSLFVNSFFEDIKTQETINEKREAPWKGREDEAMSLVKNLKVGDEKLNKGLQTGLRSIQKEGGFVKDPQWYAIYTHDGAYKVYFSATVRDKDFEAIWNVDLKTNKVEADNQLAYTLTKE